MPPPTAHMPSDSDLGGPVIISVMVVTIQLSNNGLAPLLDSCSQTVGNMCEGHCRQHPTSPLWLLHCEGYGFLVHK